MTQVPQASHLSQVSQARTPLREHMLEDMQVRELSPKTQTHYIRAVREFTRFLGASPDSATAEDLRQYQLHMVDRGTSAISLNAAITGLKFFFEITLQRPELMAKMQHVRVPRKLPAVFSREEVARLIAAAPNLRYRTALAVAYGAGQRISEVAHLKVTDIHGQRMMIRVERGKGTICFAEHLVPLPSLTTISLRAKSMSFTRKRKHSSKRSPDP